MSSSTEWRTDGEIVAAEWPAAGEAARLLAMLGASTRTMSSASAALSAPGFVVRATPTSIAQD
jgi:hypothetical protein